MSGKKIQAAGNGSRYFARKWKWVLYLHFKEKEAGIPSSGNSSLGKKIQHEEQQRPGARKRLSADLENLTVCKQSCKSEAVIYYYSMYGHVAKLAEEIKKGAASVEGVEVKLWQVPETLSDEVLGKMGAPPKSDVPFIEPNELAEADGFIFGFPTRFGMMAAQLKAFLDATGGLWRTQQLAGKPAGIFYSTGSQGGGQETTALILDIIVLAAGS